MIQAVPRLQPAFLQKHRTRHGKTAWYVRRGRGPLIRLRAEYGTEAFWCEYEAALKGEAPAPIRVRSGSLQWLYDRYRETMSWRELSAATRRQRENIFKGVMDTSGHLPFLTVRQRDVMDGRDRRHNTPAQARNFLDAMRGLFRWAHEAGHIKIDPTAGVRNPKRKATEGFKAWTDEDVGRYETRWKAGTRERVWMHVLLYIGARRGDAVLLGRQQIKAGVLTFVTEKGREKRRIEVTRRIEPELVTTLAVGPTGDLAFICGKGGEPLTKESFGNVFKEACVAAGIMDKAAHGLRKLSATIWAERGATEHELMAMFGWMTPAMAALYTRGAHRRTMALNAHDRLIGNSAS